MTRLEQALALAARGFWIFPCIAGDKKPAISDWPNKATRDRAQIGAWWALTPHNIGIATEKFGDDKALVVVDVDCKNGKDGYAELFRLELEGHELPPTLTHTTPSGGSHLIYLVDEPLKQGVDTLGVGLDIRSRGGYIVGPGSTIGGKAYEGGQAPLAAAPQWLVNRLGADRSVRAINRDPLPGVDPARAIKRGMDYLVTAPMSVKGSGGDQVAYKVAAGLKDCGCTEAQALDLMLSPAWYEGCGWAPERLSAKVVHAFKYGKEPPGVRAAEAVFPRGAPAKIAEDTAKHPFEKMNSRYAYTTAGGGGHVLFETTDEKGRFQLSHLGITAFHGWFKNQMMQIGKTTKPVSEWWMEWPQRRQYEGLVFCPGKEVDLRFYNLWRGFSVEPAATPDHPMVKRFLEHALQNVCGGHKALFHWLMGYFAHMIQRPHEKPLVALVFKGSKGVGKNALIERIGYLLGSHSMVTSNRRYLVGNFNGHLENCLLLAFDEAFWSGDKQAEGQIKDLITGTQHQIEHKNEKPYPVDNLTRVVIIGNEEWLVPATHDERRFAVFSVGDGRKQDRQYFHDMRVGLDQNGGAAHLLRYLLDFDLSGVDVNAAPATQGLLDQKHASLEPVQQWWHDCLLEGQLLGGDFGGGWPERIPTNRLRDSFERYAKKRNIRGRLPDQASVGKILHEIAPSLKHAKSVRENPADSSYSYFNPGLAVLRKDWEGYIGGELSWDEC